jgi:hypothetical protein
VTCAGRGSVGGAHVEHLASGIDEESVMRNCHVPWSTRLVGALLALSVGAVHVVDQGGGILGFTDPDWLGWSYRLIELASVLVAVAILVLGERWLSWIAAALLAGGPVIGYLLTRTIGLPGDAGDKGNWADSVGTLSLLLEGALAVLAGAIAVSAIRTARAAGAAAIPVPDERRHELARHGR